MKQQLTHFDIYDIFIFPENGDMCQFEKYSLSKKEFLAGDYFGCNAVPGNKILFYFITPTNDEVTVAELATLFERIERILHSKEFIWGCSSDDEISHYDVFLVRTY